MRFTAGNLKLCTGLVIMCLFSVLGTIHGCKPVHQAKYIEEQISGILEQYKNINGPNLTSWPRKFPQLHIHPGSIDKQKTDAVCGVNYTVYALESIYRYQNFLNYNKIHFLDHLNQTILKVKGTLEVCLHKSVLNVSCEARANPEFPYDKDDYPRKQWGLAALEHTLKFLDELIVFLQKKFPDVQ